jgi:2-haloalkanoic acid dehalogenase type II
MSLTDFAAVSFDCYGTLIDWEAGIHDGLRPILHRLPPEHRYRTTPSTVLERFSSLQAMLEADRPDLLYADILATCYHMIAQEENVEITEPERVSFGRSVKDWPAFSDSVAGLQKLKRYYKLILLSNVDHENIRATLTGPLAGVEFDAVYTAQDIGAYKPDHKNFNYLLGHLKLDFGLQQSQLLHAAKSLTADHVPTKQLGLKSAWIARGDAGVSAMGGKLEDLKASVGFTWIFSSIGALVEEVEREFQQKT